MSRMIGWILVLAVTFACAAASAESAGYGELLLGLLEAYETGNDTAFEEAVPEDEVARAIVEHWQRVYLDPGYRLYLYGTDDPADLPIEGRHAFVVLGYALRDGEMTEELMGRCNAAAAAARAFPEAILVCSGGATGENNPDGHTEAGLMREYLVGMGIAEERVFTDERAMTTAENALNTLAILREQDVQTMTIVTSGYHQRWGQVLYNAVAALYRQEYGFRVEIVGNFCYDTAPENEIYLQDARIAILQLGSILGLSSSEMALLPRPTQ